MDLQHYSWSLFSPATQQACSYQEGDAVFVWLKSDRDTGSAHVLEPASTSSCGDGRTLVQFDCNAALRHRVRPARLVPVYAPASASLRAGVWNDGGAAGSRPCGGSGAGGGVAVVCAATESYRRLARSQVTKSDAVLEIGCSAGVCTSLLARHAGRVVGVDNSPQLIREAQERNPEVHFELVDVLQSPGNLERAGAGCGVVFVDIGGNRQLAALVALLPWVQERLRPRLLVVKSEALAAAAEKWLAMEQQEQQEQRQQEQQPGQQAEQQPEQQLEQQPEQQQQQQQEQEQEQEQQQQQEQQQPHRQPQDRQEEQVQDQQQEQQQEQQPEEQQKQHQEQRQQVQKDCPRESTNAAADAEAACASSGPGCSSSSNSSRGMDAAGPPPLCPPRIPGTLRDPSGWWRQLQARCSDRPEAVANNPLFYKAKAKGFRGVHPMRFPDRRLPGGARICRPFNYAVCREGAGRCEYDHDHCHHCLQAGHRARECTL